MGQVHVLTFSEQYAPFWFSINFISIFKETAEKLSVVILNIFGSLISVNLPSVDVKEVSSTMHHLSVLLCLYLPVL